MISRFDMQRGFYQASMLGQVEDLSFAGLYAIGHNDGALKGETCARPIFFDDHPVSSHGIDLPSRHRHMYVCMIWRCLLAVSPAYFVGSAEKLRRDVHKIMHRPPLRPGVLVDSLHGIQLTGHDLKLIVLHGNGPL